ncbi:MAG: aspartate carbamoyltransferase [Patescibacteria group bacterium]
MNHLLSSQDLSHEQLLGLFDKAKSFLPTVKEKKMLKLAEGKILATLFYEPSTRTRFSFETAMLRLGGKVISNPQMEGTSSATKGESLYDTGKTVSEMADIIAMRHSAMGSVAELAQGSKVPVMNGGDGAGDHPTQGLLDLFTIRENLGRLENFTIAIIGDLKNSRVAHAQCALLSKFEGVKFIFVAPAELKMPKVIVDGLINKGFSVSETEDMAAVMEEADVISMTRVQKERFEKEADYLKHKGVYVITVELMKKAKKDALLIHPLPRVDEIEVEVDADPRAKYFEQVENGVALRMALIATLLKL